MMSASSRFAHLSARLRSISNIIYLIAIINHDICNNGSKWSILYNDTNVCTIDLKSS